MIAKLVEGGTLKPLVDKTFPFAETNAALDYVNGGRAKGKVIIAVK